MDLNDYLSVTHKEILKYVEKIDDMYLSFLEKSKRLEKSSDYYFMLQRYWPLTKINLRGWILDSDLCKLLKENGVSGYSIYELKQYFNNYEGKIHIDCSDYIEALDLYVLMDDIEALIDEKVEREMTAIWYLDERIKRIENISESLGITNVESRYEAMLSNNNFIDSSLFEELYSLILNRIESKRNASLISDTCYEYGIYFMNDVFTYFIKYGEYIQTPEHYLYENEL